MNSDNLIGWNSLTDLVLTFLPYFMIRNLKLETKTKLALSVLMGFSIFAMVACMVKTVELKVLATRDDFTYTVYMFIIWLSVENYVVIIAASIPTLRPLVLKMAKLRPGQSKSSEGRSGPAPPPYESGNLWASRTHPIRLNSDRRQSEGHRLHLEPPYIHPEPRTSPPPGTIRKTISVYIQSEGECCEMYEMNDLRPGVHTCVSAGGRSLHTAPNEEGWMTVTLRRSSSDRRRSAVTSETSMMGKDAVDLERQ
jgi:hypothetical protein